MLLICFTKSSLYLLHPSPWFAPLPLLLGNCKSVFYLCESVSGLHTHSLVLVYRCHIWMTSYSVALSLTYLTSHNTKSFHVAADGNFSFILFKWLSNIPLCVCVCVYHICMILSSVDKHLGCFHVLAILYSAAVSVVVPVSFWISVSAFSGCIPRNSYIIRKAYKSSLKQKL